MLSLGIIESNRDHFEHLLHDCGVFRICTPIKTILLVVSDMTWKTITCHRHRKCSILRTCFVLIVPETSTVLRHNTCLAESWHSSCRFDLENASFDAANDSTSNTGLFFQESPICTSCDERKFFLVWTVFNLQSRFAKSGFNYDDCLRT